MKDTFILALIQRQITLLFKVMKGFDYFLANELRATTTIYKHWSVKPKLHGSTYTVGFLKCRHCNCDFSRG